MITILFTPAFILLLQIFRCVSGEITSEIGDPLEEQYGTLIHVSLLFRHGDRGPIDTYPLDPYKNYSWPGGRGQLINPGKRRLVQVGKWFRTRYQNFVDNIYVPNDIEIVSSNVDRCIMSAQCFLFGFYPATGDQIWLENEKWQPIPIHTIPTHLDNMLQRTKECKLRTHLKEKSDSNPRYDQIYNEYKTMIELIINNTGVDVANKTKVEIFSQLKRIADTLLVYMQNNLPLPQWVKNVYPEPLSTALLKTVSNISSSIQSARLSAGPFLKSVITDMDRKVKGKKEGKLHLYSAHDTTIRTMMSALKVYKNVLPSYGSSLIFELRKKNSVNYVTVSYRNDTAKPAQLLDVPGCGLTCTYEQFYNLTKPLIPEDWNMECRLTSGSAVISSNVIIMAVVIYLVYLLK